MGKVFTRNLKTQADKPLNYTQNMGHPTEEMHREEDDKTRKDRTSVGDLLR